MVIFEHAQRVDTGLSFSRPSHKEKESLGTRLVHHLLLLLLSNSVQTAYRKTGVVIALILSRKSFILERT